MDAQKGFHLVSDDVIVGDWKWDAIGASASWTGYLKFEKDKDQFVFSGEEFNWEKTQTPGKDKRTRLFRLSNGKATLTNGNSLTLESDVESFDQRYKPKWHWKSVAPFALIPAFAGELRPEKPADGTKWGMLIVKETSQRPDK